LGLSPSFIKIDAQGAEGAVLKGARKLIELMPRLKIVVEYGPKMMVEYDDTTSEKFIRLLDGFNLIAVRKTPEIKELSQLLTAYSENEDRFTDLFLEKIETSKIYDTDGDE